MKNYLVKASLLAVLVCAPLSIVVAEDTQESNRAVEAVDIKSEDQRQGTSAENICVLDEGEDSSVVSIISEVEVDEADNNDDNNEDDDALYLQAVKNTAPISTYFYAESIYIDGMPNPVEKSWQINTYRKEDLYNSYLLLKQEAEESKKLEKEVAVEQVDAVVAPTEQVEQQEADVVSGTEIAA